MADTSVRLTTRGLDPGRAFRDLAGPGLGGIVVFVGRVRPDRVGRGEVVALDYEADRRPAVRRMEALEAMALRRHGAIRAVLWHRVGRVPAGAPSVVAGAAAPHRAEAFRAARFLIEELKRSVPLWKSARARPARRPRRPRRRPGARSTG